MFALHLRRVSKKSLWSDGSCTPSWVGTELISKDAAHAHDEAADFVASLRACAKNKDLCSGTQVHEDILRCGSELLKMCSDSLVTMYARCGALVKAQELLDMHESGDVSTWNAFIAEYAKMGQGQNALDCFERMQHRGLSPDAVTFTSLLKACGSVGAADKGQQIHDEIAKQGLLYKNVMLGNALVSMYAKCGALARAQRVLEELPTRNVISWNSLITGYAQHDKGAQALNCYEMMQRDGLCPDEVTFMGILKACGSIQAIDKGEAIHDKIAKQGLLGNNIALCNALLDMYAKCGALAKARELVYTFPFRDSISWSTLIVGYAERCEGEQALDCFEQMQHEHLPPCKVTFLSVLKACGSIGALDKGEEVHNELARKGLLEKDVSLGNAVVDMYVKCGALGKARRVLEALPVRDVITWSALIAGYAKYGEATQALTCLKQMQCEGIRPNAVTLLSILKVCGSIGAEDKGEQIYDMIAKQGLLGSNIKLGTALVDMYARCGALEKARQVLEELPVRNVVSWNALIAGYVQRGAGEQALISFENMQREGVYPSEVSYLCALQACGSIGAADKGRSLHEEIAKQGLVDNNSKLGTALVDMYAKCGFLTKARQVLKELLLQETISWNALIAGYVQHDEDEQALSCFEEMQREGISPDAVTLISILKACGSIGTADKGEQIYHEVAQQGLLVNDVVIGTSLVDMYAKCGAIAKARRVLKQLPFRDAISWNALIAGFVQEGEVLEALSCCEEMQHEGLTPDSGTLSSVLCACNCLSLVEDAQMYFETLCTKYGIEPDIEHYTCMIDLLGRAGHLDKAVGLIEKIPSCDGGVWSSLLGSCQRWGGVSAGRWAFEHSMHTDKSDGAVYALIADAYGAADTPGDATSIQATTVENNSWEKPTKGWYIDMGDEGYEVSSKLEDLAHNLSCKEYCTSFQWSSQSFFFNAIYVNKKKYV